MIKNRRRRTSINRNSRFVRHTNLGRKNKFQFSSFLRIFIKLFIYASFIIIGLYAYKFATDYLYASDKLLIEDIDVVGCNNITKTEIKELIPFKIGDNIMKVDLSKAEQEIQQCKPELKDISMSRKWMSKKVVITLKERRPEVFIMQNDEITGLDFDNVPFALRGNMFNMAIPILRYSSDQERTSLLNFIKTLKPYLGDFVSRITEVKFGDVEDIVFVVDNKTVLYWGNIKKNNIQNKIKKMKLVLEDAINKYGSVDYVDLTFLDENKNKIIIKPTAKVVETNQEVVQN